MKQREIRSVRKGRRRLAGSWFLAPLSLLVAALVSLGLEPYGCLRLRRMQVGRAAASQEEAARSEELTRSRREAGLAGHPRRGR